MTLMEYQVVYLFIHRSYLTRSMRWICGDEFKWPILNKTVPKNKSASHNGMYADSRLAVVANIQVELRYTEHNKTKNVWP